VTTSFDIVRFGSPRPIVDRLRAPKRDDDGEQPDPEVTEPVTWHAVYLALEVHLDTAGLWGPSGFVGVRY
jgi:hypothetical protein